MVFKSFHEIKTSAIDDPFYVYISGTAWSNWCLLGAIVSCIPVLGFLKERYNRLEVDEIQDMKDDTNKL